MPPDSASEHALGQELLRDRARVRDRVAERPCPRGSPRSSRALAVRARDRRRRRARLDPHEVAQLDHPAVASCARRGRRSNRGRARSFSLEPHADVVAVAALLERARRRCRRSWPARPARACAASTPSAAAFSRSGITRSSGRPSFRLLSRSTKPPVRASAAMNWSAERVELVELEVAAQLAPRTRRCCRRPSSPTDRTCAPSWPGIAAEHARAPASMISCTSRSRSCSELQHREHHAARWVLADAVGPADAHAGEERRPPPAARASTSRCASARSSVRLERRCRAGSRSRRRSGPRPTGGKNSAPSCVPKPQATRERRERDAERRAAVRERPVEQRSVAASRAPTKPTSSRW